MARKLENYDFGHRRKRRYDWDQWMNGEIWSLVAGEDFEILASGMRNAVYKAAATRGLRARTAVENNNLVIQAYRDERAPGSTN